MRDGSGDIWVFGYGSLMWQPGFRYAEAVPARLSGFHRALCIYSVHYRGSYACPGLVLGLDRSGTCDGVAFRVAKADRADAVAYLRRRELIYGVYHEASVAVRLYDGSRQTVRALTYIAERAHPHYAGRLPILHQSRIVRTAHGKAGSNLGYLVSTLQHLRQLGLREPHLERTLVLAGSYVARGHDGSSRVPVRRAARAQWTSRPSRSPRLMPELRQRLTFRARMADAH